MEILRRASVGIGLPCHSGSKLRIDHWHAVRYKQIGFVLTTCATEVSGGRNIIDGSLAPQPNCLANHPSVLEPKAKRNLTQYLQVVVCSIQAWSGRLVALPRAAVLRCCRPRWALVCADVADAAASALVTAAKGNAIRACAETNARLRGLAGPTVTSRAARFAAGNERLSVEDFCEVLLAEPARIACHLPHGVAPS